MPPFSLGSVGQGERREAEIGNGGIDCMCWCLLGIGGEDGVDFSFDRRNSAQSLRLFSLRSVAVLAAAAPCHLGERKLAFLVGSVGFAMLMRYTNARAPARRASGEPKRIMLWVQM
jgi:hypothetical protein